ncbi:hypothetical protein, conserved in T. vivax [Trypanosoma vivax Y486]|uniref:Uncharacterized protein n=1 Tax=Trypanosoma vivax (strain Y486) TaxID=1055687 RepID=F9WU41_TRYVY|nr:hypothetical protein, conserved in T. vivax [Trypanosoma vivax Y486]|eukprot:CCD21088.1 hypothetical protein, conserved in T. vivax [Trypanosoma vivax Y486]
MMALRVALLLMCCSVCAFATGNEVEKANTTMDPLQIVNKSFSELSRETCATALLCLWLELVKLPRKRMIERIDTVFKQFESVVNVTKERAMLEEDETFTNSSEAREVLHDMRRQLEVAQGLDAKLEKSRRELLIELAKDDRVVMHMHNALSTISVAAAAGVGKSGGHQISLQTTQQDVETMKNYANATAIANRTVELIEKLWWNEDATYLVERLTTLINTSLALCLKAIPQTSRRITYFPADDHKNAILFAKSGQLELVHYMGNITAIDQLSVDQRSVSSLGSLVRNTNFSSQFKTFLTDMAQLRNIGKKMKTQRKRYANLVRLDAEERRVSSCTDLWSQLFGFVFRK